MVLGLLRPRASSRCPPTASAAPRWPSTASRRGWAGCPTAACSSTPASTGPSCGASRTAPSSATASLEPWATWHANDMVVAANGQAYAGNFGFDLDGLYDGTRASPATIATTSLVRVDPDGTSHEAAADLAFPNGTVITDDGATLIIAESMGGRLSAFDRAARRHARAIAASGPRCTASPPTASACAPTARSGWPTRSAPNASGWPKAARCSSGSPPPELLRLHARRRGPPHPLPRHRHRQPTTPRPAPSATAPSSGSGPRSPAPACPEAASARGPGGSPSRAWSARCADCAPPARCAARSR